MAKHEKRPFDNGGHVWIRKYLNLRNLSHWHFEPEILLCECGNAVVMNDGKFFQVNEGNIAYFSSENVHNIDCTENSKVIVAQFFFEESDFVQLEPECPVFKDNYNAIKRLNEINDERVRKDTYYPEKMDALMKSLIIDIFRGEKVQHATAKNKYKITKYKTLLENLEEHPEEYSFKDAAKFLNMSEAYFSRYFKSMTGIAFSNYLNIIKVNHALTLMSENPTIKMSELMLESGFETIRNFNRVFKEVTGYSPTNLPPDFRLNKKEFQSETASFNPTLDSSIEI